MKNKLKKSLIVLTFVSVLFFFSNGKGYLTAKMEGYKALKVFAYIKNTELMPEFNAYETEHFILRYTPKDADIVGYVGKVLERSYKAVGEDYGYYPKVKTLVFMYDSQESMWKYQQAVSGQAVMGLYNMGIIHILSPKVYRGSGQIRSGDFDKDGPILHEYTHRVVDDMSAGNVEMWLTEGLALYEELDVYGVEWAKGYDYKNYYTSSELRSNFVQLDEVKAYKQSLRIVRSLVRNYGRNRLVNLLSELKAGNNLDSSFAKVYGMSLNEFIDSGKW